MTALLLMILMENQLLLELDHAQDYNPHHLFQKQVRIWFGKELHLQMEDMIYFQEHAFDDLFVS
jgi:hypothetical protein